MITRLRFSPVLSILLIVAFGGETQAVRHEYSKELDDYTEKPQDSAEAENLRIWIPIEREAFGRVTVDIFCGSPLCDSSYIIRHFLGVALGSGYFNVFWDKKDDSGRWVEPGEYSYQIDDIGKIRSGKLTVNYQPSERSVLLYRERRREAGLVRFDILADSVLVSAGLYHWRGGKIDQPIKDSMMFRGSYEYHWPVDKTVRRGKYRFHLEAAGFTHRVRISRIKPPGK